MKERPNKNHRIPCACFECDMYPKRLRYIQDEWENTYKDAVSLCKFCNSEASSHATNWNSEGSAARAACVIEKLQSNGIHYSIPFPKSNRGYSSEHFYIPADD